ncbi:MAG TPA: type I pantothenate kinase [Gemmatimonadales bacterium]
MSRRVPQPSPFEPFTRAQWRRRRDTTPLTLSEEEVDRMRGVNEPVSLKEVEEIYLPLSRLLSLHVAAIQELHATTGTFLERRIPKVPYVIGIAGSVAVGKSTFARLLQTLLARWPSHPRVDLVTTDGFLFPNRVLRSRGLMDRKGFPESYDLRRLVQFLADLKSAKPVVRAPVYSHLTYDIVPGRHVTVHRPDIVILEGLGVLHAGTAAADGPQVFVSDFFDFSIYIDADETNIRQWFIERFLTFRKTAFRDPSSYFKRFARLSVPEARAMATKVWRTINGRNLRENILPTRTRANLILVKGADHRVQRVLMRRL